MIMTEIEKLLNDCGCTDYDVCLEYLQRCFPELNITCVTQEDYYMMGRDEFIKLAKQCLAKKVEKYEYI